MKIVDHDGRTPCLPGMGPPLFAWPGGCRCPENRGPAPGTQHGFPCGLYCPCDPPNEGRYTNYPWQKGYVCHRHRTDAYGKS